jgi:hypothetical protein
MTANIIKRKRTMTPSKIKEHEPTAVKREMTEKIIESAQTGTNPEEAKELARKKGMAKVTAGAAETGFKSEQGGCWIKQIKIANYSVNDSLF